LLGSLHFASPEGGMALAYRVQDEMSFEKGIEGMSVRERPLLRGVPAGAELAPQEQTKAEQFATLLEGHRGERHIIVLQSFPDPDAISSAFAHQMIAARYGIECDIAYDGRISHHENIALVEALQLHLLRVTGK
jgi:hypothetical protein